MADETKFTQADIDKAVKAATDKIQESIDNLEAKNAELVADVRKARQAARSDVKPEDLHAAEERADKAEARAKELDGQVKALTKERDTAVKSLETEQGAARSYAVDAEIASAIAAGSVIPALVPAFTAMVKGQAKAELADGKYTVKIGDKPAKDYVSEFLATEDGKHFKGATMNGGGGAGGGGNKGSAATMTRTAFDALDQGAKAEAGAKSAKGELTIVDG